jgi:hypothetical protein
MAVVAAVVILAPVLFQNDGPFACILTEILL